MRKILPLLSLALAPLVVSSPEAASIEETPQVLCSMELSETARVLSGFRAQFAQAAPLATEQRFSRQSKDIASLVHAVCLSAVVNEPIACKKGECAPTPVAVHEVSPFELSGFSVYTTVDQPFFNDGMCSVFGLQVDTLTQVSSAGTYSPETGSHIADTRKLAIRSAVEACLDLRRSVHTTCRPFVVGRGNGLECWESRRRDR